MASHDEREELRERAEQILAGLRDAPLERPVFVEFAGTPKSGKSTCIEIVRHFFRRLEYKVLAPAEGASRRTPYYFKAKNDLIAFNTWSASYALMHLLEGLHGPDQYDLAILDRGLFDALAWFELLATDRPTSKRIISDQFRDQVQDFLQIDHWRSAIDAVLLFTTDAKTAMTRENSDKLISEPGQAMNETFLDELNDAYDRVRTKYAGQFSRFESIDTGAAKQTNPQSTAHEVAHIILDVFDAAPRTSKEGRP